MKIIYSSDTHSYLFPTSYQEVGDKNIGLLRLSENMQKDEDTLYIDGGDTLQGSALAKYVLENNLPLIQADVFNKMGLDIVVPGNHDFNFGYDNLFKYFSSLNAEVLCANVVDKTECIKFQKNIIKTDSKGLKIGFIGAVTEFINVWERKENLDKFTISPAFDAIKTEIDNIQSSVDKIVVIYHGGFEADLDKGKILSFTKENLAYKMAMELDIDLLLTGHQHLDIPLKEVNNTKVLQLPAFAIKLAKIEVLKDVISSSYIYPNENAKIDNKLLALNNDVNVWLDTPLAKIDEKIEIPSLLDSAKNSSRVADFFNHVIKDYTKADVSATALANKLFAFGPNITIRDIIANYQFQNTIVIFSLDRDEIKLMLERAAEYFAYDSEGSLCIADSFLRPKVENYNYDYYLGLSYTFDIRRKKGDRVTKILFDGKEIIRPLKVAVTSYRSTGAGGYNVFVNAKKIEETTEEVQELAINYLLKHKDNLAWQKSDFTLMY